MISFRFPEKRYLLILFSGLAMSASASEPAKPLPISGVSARNLATLLARSCSERNWVEYSTAVATVDFFNQFTLESLEAHTTKRGVKAAAVGIEVKSTRRGIELTDGSDTFIGEDACQAIEEYSRSKKSQGKLAEATLLASLVGAAKSSSKKSANDLASAATAVILSQDPTTRLAGTKLDLEKILDTSYSARCTESLTSIQTAIHKIVVKKGKDGSVNVFDRDSDISIVMNEDSPFKRGPLDTYIAISKKCQNGEDGDIFERQASDVVDEAREKASAHEKRVRSAAAKR